MRPILALMFLLICHALPANASQVEEITSPYGFKVWVMEDHSLPIVSVHMAFKHSGFAYDTEGKEGLAYLVCALLDEGAGDMDSTAFKQALERRAIRLGFDVDEDNVYVSMKTLKENLPEALSLFKLALTAPRFDEEAIERVKNQLYTAMEARKEDPASQADEVFRKTIFGSHPYGHVNIGTKTSLAAITREDLVHYTKQHFTRVPLLISAVGDIKPQEIASLLDQYFIDLPLTASDISPIPEFTTFPTGKEKTIPLHVPQSTVIFGFQGIKREDPEYYAALVLNYIVGGGSFASRLMEEVREKRGLAYTVSTTLEVPDHAALFKGYVASESSKIRESLAIIRDVLRQVQEKGVTQEELDNAKNYLIGSFPLGLDKNEKLAAYLISMQLKKLGKDFLEKRNEYIQKVTLEDVNRVARRMVAPDRLVTVIVGSTVEEGRKTDAIIPSGH